MWYTTDGTPLMRQEAKSRAAHGAGEADWSDTRTEGRTCFVTHLPKMLVPAGLVNSNNEALAKDFV